MRINLTNPGTWLSNLLRNPNLVKWGKRLLFTAGLVVFTLVQLMMIVRPMMNRTAPVETDDAYTYILKAAQMQECFRQDCPALNDLREQLTVPSNTLHISWARYREYVRAFFIYHPLHSVILLGLHNAGLAWEDAYKVLEVMGSLMLSLAICYWLYHLFDAGPAGIALLLLTVTPFPNQGLHYIVPSNLTLGIALFAWAGLLQRPKRSPGILIGSTIALVLMHPIGRLYALLSTFLFILLNVRQMKRTDWLASGASILIVGITFLLPIVISRPELSFSPEPPPADWNTLAGYYNNFSEAAIFVSSWLRLYGGLPMTVFFICVGLVSLPPTERRARVLNMTFLLGGLLCVSLLQVLPRYPAEAFGRIWVPSVIVLTGFMAHGVWQWAATVVHWVHQLLQTGKYDFRDETRLLSSSGWTGVFLLFFGVIFLHNSINSAVEGQSALRTSVKDITWNQDSLLDVKQPYTMLNQGCKSVLYMFEVPMHFYLTHGALKCGAIYYPALASTPEEEHWIQKNQNLEYAVTWNPTVRAALATGGNPLLLGAGDQLEFLLPKNWTSTQIYVYLENAAGDSELRIFPLNAESNSKSKSMERIFIPAHETGWQVIEIAADELENGFRLVATQVPERIYLRGIKSTSDAALNWPWDQGINLIVKRDHENHEPVEIKFDTASLIPVLQEPLTVLDDHGDTVLIKINR